MSQIYNPKAVYISYARNDKNHTGWENIEKLANELHEEITKGDITCYIDKKHVEIGDQITDFEDAIGKGECVILVFSERYFMSPHCMYEYMQIKEGRQNNHVKRFFAINADNCDVRSHSFRENYVKHWGGEKATYDTATNASRDILDKAMEYGFYIEEIKNIPRYLSKNVYATAKDKDELLKSVYKYFKKTYDPETIFTRICKFVKNNIVAIVLLLVLLGVLGYNYDLILPKPIQDPDNTVSQKNGGNQGEHPSPSSVYVDLGLPSGVLWASCNVGTQSAWEYGSYFAWGETKTKTEYSMSTYQHRHAVLGKYDDAATANLGTEWRMPTSKEYDELKTQCDWQWTTNYDGHGCSGYIVRSRKYTDRAIFIPAAGCMRGTRRSDVGEQGYYWTSTISEVASGYASSLFFNRTNVSLNNDNRYEGFPIRPVRR